MDKEPSTSESGNDPNRKSSFVNYSAIEGSESSAVKNIFQRPEGRTICRMTWSSRPFMNC